MKLAGMDYIINTVFKTNILPVISECNTSCIFCSHKQNPSEIEVFRLPNLELSDFIEIIDFISPNKKVVIGEAATRIIEGEPFLHKDILSILHLIRKKYPHMPIQITTNGLLLNDTIIKTLVELGNVELNISVNCIDPIKRMQILGLKREQDITDVILSLKGRVKYSGSCVIVPDIMDWKDVEEIISFLDKNQGENVRLFLPGYTKKSGNESSLFKLFKEAKKFVDVMRDTYTIPILLEPSFIEDLECRIEGIIKNTPANSVGLMVGDVIQEINGMEVKTRVDGFDKTFKAVNPKLKIRRVNENMELKLLKPKNTSPGFVVLYDIDSAVTDQIQTVVKRYEARNVLFITSELALPILSKLFERSEFQFAYKLIRARNDYFGGNIQCAGLLIVQDILDAVEEYLKSNERPDLIVLPPIMFDFKKRDLLGRHINEIEDVLKIKTDFP